MNDQLTLSESEWEIVLDLLVRERRELPAEIRHTDSRDYRHKLQERLNVVEALISRIEGRLAARSAVAG